MKKYEPKICTVYNEDEDRMELWIKTWDETKGRYTWGFTFSTVFTASDKDPDKEYLHMNLLGELNRAIGYGYEYIGQRSKQFIELD